MRGKNICPKKFTHARFTRPTIPSYVEVSQSSNIDHHGFHLQLPGLKLPTGVRKDFLLQSSSMCGSLNIQILLYFNTPYMWVLEDKKKRDENKLNKNSLHCIKSKYSEQSDCNLINQSLYHLNSAHLSFATFLPGQFSLKYFFCSIIHHLIFRSPKYI